MCGRKKRPSTYSIEILETYEDYALIPTTTTHSDVSHIINEEGYYYKIVAVGDGVTSEPSDPYYVGESYDE